MNVVCAYCKKFIRTVGEPSDKRVSHGICEACEPAANREVDEALERQRLKEKKPKENPMREEPVETEIYKGYTIEIYPDMDGTSPREYEKIGTLVAQHRRYSFDESKIRFDDYGSWKEVEKVVREELGALFVYPLFMHEHGNIRLSLGAFGDKWDSGQLGLFYLTAEDLKTVGLKKTEKAKIDKLAHSLIEEYSNYVNGEVYGYKVLDKDGEEVDSCWGFIGAYYDKDAYIMQEARSAVDHASAAWHKKQISKGFFRKGNYNPHLKRS